MALTECEAPNIAAAAGQGLKAEADTGSAKSNADSFKKELEDCEAMMPIQQPAAGGSTEEADDGIQEGSETVDTISGAYCICEGLEMPVIPPGIAQISTLTADISTDSTEATMGAAAEGAQSTGGYQTGSMPELNARTQTTTPGPAPGKTQDEILKAVGAYLDTGESGAKSASDPAQTQTAGTTGPVQEAVPEGPRSVIADAVSENAAQGDGQPGDARSDVKGQMQAAASATAEADVAGVSERGEDKGVSVKQMPAVQTELEGDAGKAQAVSVQQAAEPRAMTSAAADAAGTGAAESKAAESSADVKENVLRIVDKVSTQAKDGRYEFDVELKPDFLGKVSIKLTMEGGNIRMQIKAEDASVRGMLSDQTSSLTDALKEKGITLTSINVTQEGQASSLGGNRQPYEQGGSRQNAAYYAQTGTAVLESAAEPYSCFIGNSSVEFLA